ncbi:MAG: hypothetical protein AAGK97_13970, partial [Bacteroidota bacterium]
LIETSEVPWKESKLKEVLKEDDLLGIKKLTINTMSDNPIIQFWGVHFLDEFEYQLKVNFK